MKNDYLIRALSKNKEVRAFAVKSTSVVDKAMKSHESKRMSTIVLGEVLTSTLMMADMLKSSDDLITTIIKGNGPIKQVLVTGEFDGTVRGYVSNPNVDELTSTSKAIGQGTLTVIRDLGMKEPYSSTLQLGSTSIANNLNYYFAQSEQTPSIVGLDVKVEDDKVIIAGGYIVQFMPNFSDKSLDIINKNIANLPEISKILLEGTPEDLLEKVMEGLEPTFSEKKEVAFRCNCSFNRGKKVLATLGKEEINKLILEGKDIEVTCDFCLKRYKYTVDDLKEILKEI